MSPRTSQILSTKLRPPALLAEAIDRPRLTTHLACNLPKVMLVTAAAGFGKTTLVAQCHRHLGERAVWLSLDRADRNTFVFVSHLIAGFNRQHPVVSSSTESFVEGRVASLDVDEVTIRIANDLDRLDDDRVLFLDDYHLAETPELNELVQLLIERTSARLHLVIASRVTPALPIARYRASDALHELNAHDLAFNTAEADSFLRQVHDLRLSRHQLGVLLGHTEGWGAGLQLASLFLKESPDHAEALQALSGDTRDIADYLASEVVRRQPEEVQQFLLYTSILERMNADVCNALTGRDDAQAMIERIEAQGLFLFPLDLKRKWYRYHHLFRDFLRVQLGRQHAGAPLDLYRIASQWFENAGLDEEAANLTLDGGDFDHAAQLVERLAIRMITRGDVPQVARWMQRFPEEVTRKNPRLLLYRCWAMTAMGHVDTAERLLQQVGGNAEALVQGSDDARHLLQAEIHILRTMGALVSDDIERASAMASVRFPETPAYQFLSANLWNVAGLAALARGDFSQAMACAVKAEPLNREIENLYGVCYAQCLAGLVHLAQGRLLMAREAFARAIRDAVQCTGEHSFNAAMPRMLLAVVDYETNDLDAAHAVLERELPRVAECGYVEAVRTSSFLAMAGILGARGDVPAALAHLEQAITSNIKTTFERTNAVVNSESIRLKLAAGDLAGAQRFARHAGIDHRIPLPDAWSRVPVHCAISRCRLLVAEGRADAAIPDLQALVRLARHAGRVTREIQLLSLLLVAYARAGQQAAAFATAKDILALGAAEGFIRSILDQGDVAGATFLAFARNKDGTAQLSSAEADYLARICAAATTTLPAAASATPSSPSAATHVPVDGVIESLTEKELRVLRLLSEGASNTQIGASLFISVNTVRWHVANILSKLHVENRTQAAASAHLLHLVD